MVYIINGLSVVEPQLTWLLSTFSSHAYTSFNFSNFIYSMHNAINARRHIHLHD